MNVTNLNFHINDFEGPLDLLLHLIKEAKMDIYDIKIEVITQEYLDFIQNAKDLNIDIASEYLIMASELIHLKSKVLINKTDEEDEDIEINSVEDLQNKLIEYEKYKNICQTFKSLEENRNNFFTKTPSSLNEYIEPSLNLKSDVTIDDLYNAFSLFLERHKLQKPLNTKITKKEYNIKERISNIRTILQKEKKINFFDLFDIITKDYIIITFLSVLEMTKDEEIVLKQEHNFSDITIEMK